MAVRSPSFPPAVTCRNSEATARRLEELGHGRVLVYSEGKEDWIEHALPVERAG